MHSPVRRWAGDRVSRKALVRRKPRPRFLRRRRDRALRSVMGRKAMVRTSLRGRTRQIADGNEAALGHSDFTVMFAATHRYSTGLPLMDAQWDFRRARRAYLA